LVFLISTCKGSASRAENKIYFDFPEAQPTLREANGSASRAENKIYFDFPEAQPASG
jgi:hypothetical protein